jgi:phosphoglycerate dehydrogenase-like enzyme
MQPGQTLNLLVVANPDLPQLKMLKALGPDVTIHAGKTLEALCGAAAGADVLLNCDSNQALLRDVWGLAARVKWVHCLWAGVDRVLFPELVSSPVPLTNAKGVFAEALGEFVLGAVLYFAKDFRRMIRSQGAAIWDPFDVEWARGRTIGILGFGGIGRAVARRARVLEMRVVAFRRHPDLSVGDPVVDEVYSSSDLVSVLPRIDYFVAAVPLTDETRGLVGAKELRALPPSAVLINVGRGPVIQERALIKALVNGRLRGAALDVFDTEPLPAKHAFFGMENVLLSPHCADRAPGWIEDAFELFIDNFRRFRSGQPLLNLVDKAAGY